MAGPGPSVGIRLDGAGLMCICAREPEGKEVWCVHVVYVSVYQIVEVECACVCVCLICVRVGWCTVDV